MKTILVVEDNADLAFGLAANLEYEGFRVSVVHDGGTVLPAIDASMPDLIVLDLMLPVMSGYDVLRQLRDRHYNVPVLVLSARTDEADVVRAFRCGADDYVRKPFSVLEFAERVRARLRDGHPGEPAVIRVGNLTLDPGSRRVRAYGEPVHLAPKEFDLLLALIRSSGRVLSRKELLATVWRIDAPIRTRTIDYHVRRLRQKLKPHRLDHRVITVARHGFRWTDDPESA